MCMMKCYHILECDCLEEIRKETLTWVKNNTNWLEGGATRFWNPTDIDPEKDIPTVVKYLKKMDLEIRQVWVGVLMKHDEVKLHTDEQPMLAKINFPILNTKNTYTEWWDSNYMLARVETADNVMVFNSSIPHKAVAEPDAILPRIQLHTTFVKDCRELLGY